MKIQQFLNSLTEFSCDKIIFYLDFYFGWCIRCYKKKVSLEEKERERDTRFTETSASMIEVIKIVLHPSLPISRVTLRRVGEIRRALGICGILAATRYFIYPPAAPRVARAPTGMTLSFRLEFEFYPLKYRFSKAEPPTINRKGALAA